MIADWIGGDPFKSAQSAVLPPFMQWTFAAFDTTQMNRVSYQVRLYFGKKQNDRPGRLESFIDVAAAIVDEASSLVR